MATPTPNATLRHPQIHSLQIPGEERAHAEAAGSFTLILPSSWGCSGAVETRSEPAKLLTLPWIILSHLHLLDTFCREPAGPSLHGSFPKATFADAQHCGKTETGA